MPQSPSNKKKKDSTSDVSDESVEQPESVDNVGEQADKEAEALRLSNIEAEEVIASSDEEPSSDPDTEVKVVRIARGKRWWKKRRFIIPAAVGCVIILLLLIPVVRYSLFSWAIHKNVSVAVTDSRTGIGIADADVVIGGKTARTDQTGKAVLQDVPIGYHDVSVTKKYYKTQTERIAVDVITTGDATVRVTASGTITKLAIIDRLTEKPVADAVVAASERAFGKTNASGEIEVVIPTGKKELPVTVTSPKHNVLSTVVTSKSKQLFVIPTGSVYFLKKNNGKVDVVKTNYDGSDQRVVIPGTGNEQDSSTLFVSSRDGQNAMLIAKRAPNKPESLYLLNTKDDKYKIVDDQTAQFTALGWAGRYFVYQTARLGNDKWREKTTVLKSYDTATGRTTVLDENASDPGSSDGAALYETIGAYYVTDSTITYAKTWVSLGAKTVSVADKKSTIVTVKPDGSDRKVLKSLDASKVTSVAVTRGVPGTAYFTIDGQMPTDRQYGELSGGSYRDSTSGDAAKANYPAYVVSPSGNKTAWSETRGTTFALFVGDKNGDNKQELSANGGYQAYGWLSEDRLIVQKSNSELYVATIDQLKRQREPLKIDNYFRINNSFVSGYGAR